MRVTHDSSVDLNLLSPLRALLEERHISRAAARLNMSQPAMSRALARLRRTFGDELLIRGADGYQLTPRAERLERQLLSVMSDLDSMFAGDDFDPASATETYRITGTDYAALCLGPMLFRRLFRESPQSRIVFSAWHDEVFDDLERGAIDLVFFGVAAPARMRSQELFEEHFNCVMSAGHPLADRAGLDLEAYLGCAHVSIEVSGGDQTVIDRHLLTLGTRRQVSLRLPYHTAAAAAIPGTSLVGTLPARLTAALADDPDLRVVRAPAELDSMTYQMSWHPRLDGDPAHRWLRRLITEVVSKDF